MLDPVEQLLFERLSMFAGGWTFQAAEQVCADDDTTLGEVCVRRQDVVDLLARLTAKSMVTASPEATGGMRFRLLETLRQYARERLAQHGEVERTGDRHANYFVTWAEQTMSPSDTSYQLAAASIELENLRSALRWILDRGDAERALRLGAAMRWYLFRHGWLSEGYQWFSQILKVAESHPDTEALGHVLAAAALQAGRQATMAEAERLHTRVVRLWRTLGNQQELARSLSQLGYVLRYTGRLTQAQQCFEEGCSIARDARLLAMEAMNSIGLAEVLYDQERYEEALVLAQRTLAIHHDRFFARNPGRSWTRRVIGMIHYQRGDPSVARSFLEEAVEEARAADGLGWWLCDALACAAQLDIDAHRFARAHGLLREALEPAAALGDQRMMVCCLERLAYLAAAQGQYERALRLDCAAKAVRAAIGLVRTPVEIRMLDSWLEPAERGLGPGLREQVHSDAASMTLDETIAYAQAFGVTR